MLLDHDHNDRSRHKNGTKRNNSSNCNNSNPNIKASIRMHMIMIVANMGGPAASGCTGCGFGLLRRTFAPDSFFALRLKAAKMAMPREEWDMIYHRGVI